MFLWCYIHVELNTVDTEKGNVRPKRKRGNNLKDVFFYLSHENVIWNTRACISVCWTCTVGTYAKCRLEQVSCAILGAVLSSTHCTFQKPLRFTATIPDCRKSGRPVTSNITAVVPFVIAAKNNQIYVNSYLMGTFLKKIQHCFKLKSTFKTYSCH